MSASKKELSSQKRSLRTQVMRHVAGFMCMGIFFLFSSLRVDRSMGTESNVSLLLYLLAAGIIYFLAYRLYPSFHRAWKDSKR